MADRVGWSNHSVIAAELNMSVRQIRNFKLKFPKDRWREEGTEESAEDGGGDTLTETDDRLSCGAETEEEDPLQDELQPETTGSASTRSILAGSSALADPARYADSSSVPSGDAGPPELSSLTGGAETTQSEAGSETSDLSGLTQPTQATDLTGEAELVQPTQTSVLTGDAEFSQSTQASVLTGEAEFTQRSELFESPCGRAGETVTSQAGQSPPLFETGPTGDAGTGFSGVSPPRCSSGAAGDSAARSEGLDHEVTRSAAKKSGKRKPQKCGGKRRKGNTNGGANAANPTARTGGNPGPSQTGSRSSTATKPRQADKPSGASNRPSRQNRPNRQSNKSETAKPDGQGGSSGPPKRSKPRGKKSQRRQSKPRETANTGRRGGPSGGPQRRTPSGTGGDSRNRGGDAPRRTERPGSQRRGAPRRGAPSSQGSGSAPTERSQASSSGAEAPRPPSRQWLTLAYEEISEEDRKGFADFVGDSLEKLEENFEWEEFEKVVQALIDKVSATCEKHMAERTTSRTVNPNQGWRWRQRRRGGQSSSQDSSGSPNSQEAPAGTRPPPEIPASSGRGHAARARRRQAARRRYNGPEAQRLQRLFRRNRKSCVREILEGQNTRRCNIPVEELEAYFRNEYSAEDVDLDNPPSWLNDCLKEPDNPPEWEEIPIDGEEVKAQLKRLPSASAPGPDRLPYKVWKAVDPSGTLLAQIFEICRRERKVPRAWKTSTTVLIYKKGDEGVPSNWRPISLQSAIYKIYASILAKRLATWAREADAISPSQKGFVPGEGCLEHAFLARSMMEDARRRRKPIHLLWFDLKNAFGSVSHQLLWFAMERLGVPSEMVSIIQDIYEGSSFKVVGENSSTGDIPQGRGVKQGCPLSPLVFNLALEGLIRGIETSSAKGYSFSDELQVKSLAYADDLATASSSEEDTKVMLARIEEFTSWAKLRFNVAKCASLSASYRSSKRVVLQTKYSLCGRVIPPLKWEDRYRHLGVLLGPNPEACLAELAAEFRESTEKIFQSGLADWMKLEAFKEFVMPKLDYAFRSTLAHRKWARELDRFVRRTVKRSLGLPGRVCDAFFYVPTNQGGLGLRSVEDELGNLMMTHAVKMLTSPDPLVRGVAMISLDGTIKKRLGETEGPEDRWRFLSGQIRRTREGSRGDISTLWSRVRDFVGEAGVRLHGGTDEDPKPTGVSVGDREIPGDFRRVLLRELRTKRAQSWLKKWTSLGEQGSLAQTFSQTSESNFWIRDCRFLRYREYRFAIKARLNLLPVAAHKIKYGGSVASARCKGCTGNIETQEHMLSVCPRNMPKIKARHDKVMERLVRAIPGSLGTKFLDQTVPNCSGLQRPDVVILNEEQKKAYLVDVTCPCETTVNMASARQRKVDKYADVKGRLEEKGYDTVLDAFVVGTLGTWDPLNDPLLRKLGIGRRYGTLFKKLCCRDAIAGSYEVWTSKCQLHQQRSSS